MIDIGRLKTFAEVKATIYDWAGYYNNERMTANQAASNQYYEFVRTGVHPMGLEQCQTAASAKHK
jgi:hypothetical protein